MKELIVLPNYLSNPVFLEGIDQPLNDIADILDEQDRHQHASAVRDALTIIQTFTKVNINKTHNLFTP
jgi:hypothetical protein